VKDYRDLTIENQAHEIVMLRERITSLEDDVESYRQMAIAGIVALHDRTVERDRLREQHRRLQDEYRNLRETLMREAVAA
jgi:hypothetical protein